ncbi:hypothetical protein MKEN_00345900 [Mycena kentingensis (nom. inval.)]|nr:hypothetical protein MKEN_00345900 [Mycena kentingensis (nom. inval.)]
MLDLPPELWLRIISFIPDESLVRLVGVNLLFYSAALDTRYSTIYVQKVGTKAEKLFERLRDPVPAGRVRKLIFRPHVSPAEAARAARPTSPTSTSSRIRRILQRKQPEPVTVVRLVELLRLAFPVLVNLRSFEVEAWDMTQDLRGFFREAWTAFGQNLEAISIGGRPENFRHFVESQPHIPNCRSFNLQFTHEVDTMANSAVVGILVDCVAPYINSIAPQLTMLKIWSWSTLDLSALFAHLGSFPLLSEFHLRAPFNKAFTDPAGLTRLLETNSSSLERVELRLNQTNTGMDKHSEGNLGDWLLSHKDHPEVMKDLKILRLYPTNLDSGFQAVLTYLERSPNLQVLAIKDRYLYIDEIEMLITPLSARSTADGEGLQHLRLNVRLWSAELFELFAEKLPGLHSLSLYVGGSSPDRAASERFFSTLRESEACRSWKLHDIGIWQGGQEIPSTAMKELAQCIPAVQSFWGNGHMFGDERFYEAGFTSI